MAKIPDVKFPTYEEMAKNVAEKALDDFCYKGKTIREWIQIIAEQDAISRQAAIMAMNELHVTDRDVYGMELSKCFDNDRANGKLLSLPPVQPTSGWIPVSERLPEKSTWVLVTCKNSDGYIFLDIKLINQYTGLWEGDEDEDFSETVLAWMPLPDPYKESEDKE